MFVRSVGASVFFVGATTLPLLSPTASADVLFSDNFEGDTPSQNDVTVLPTVLSADVGTYDTDDTNGRVAVWGTAVSNPTNVAPNVNSPAAPTGGGTQGLRLQPPSGGGRNAGVLSQPASVNGSTFRMDFDAYTNGNFSFGFGSQLTGEFGETAGVSSPGSGRPKQSFLLNLAANNIQARRDLDDNPGTANTNTGSPVLGTYTTNAWQHYALEYVIGSGQVSLFIGANPAPIVIQDDVTTPYPAFLSLLDADFDNTNGLQSSQVNSLTQVDTIFFATGTAGSIGYVDNIVVTAPIPEPAALGILGLAGLLALRRRRSVTAGTSTSGASS